MAVSYPFVPEYKLEEEMQKKLIKSYAAKLLEICGGETLVVSVDEEGIPVVFHTSGRLSDASDFVMDTY